MLTRTTCTSGLTTPRSVSASMTMRNDCATVTSPATFSTADFPEPTVLDDHVRGTGRGCGDSGRGLTLNLLFQRLPARLVEVLLKLGQRRRGRSHRA
ncbi:Uncharacterised protein [Mycobacteroides abscessus subsp. abscessus]|nr:Uncharacterised protein [Mycobacteroides abscessus subsp. abscessus]